MSKKSPKIAALLEECHGYPVDPHYVGYFACFNRQLFFEAHDVLEELWLQDRHGPEGAFYKGLIQLAGAFVHLQKKRPGPSVALFKLARVNLSGYAPEHSHLDVKAVLDLIDGWASKIHQQTVMDLQPNPAPRLDLMRTCALQRPC